MLYHRRSPLDHLWQLKDQLAPGGELVLETLVVEGDENTVLVPGDRYAQMRNVYFIPSAAALKMWLEKCGFIDVRIVDACVTSTDEQRRTEWMTSESLGRFPRPAGSAQNRGGVSGSAARGDYRHQTETQQSLAKKAR
ncbi:tRNA (5-methoxyuridine) 34 synthase [Klebsiella variicola]|nr:tRNA (5-methoxyuridine) 34 synthase [Klebsiella variicola]